MRLDRRIPEPELMEDPTQARAYSEADFAAPHQAVVDDLVWRYPDITGRAGRVVDLGCGPADLTARVAQALPEATVVGLDAGPVMLGLGRDRIARLGLEARVSLIEDRLPDLDPALRGRFDVVISNSVLHHLPEPGWLWSGVTALGAPGAVVHVADLRRPESTDALAAIVAREATGEPDVLVEDFARSLAAAYRDEEVQAQLDAAGLSGALSVLTTSDRHLLVTGRLPG